MEKIEKIFYINLDKRPDRKEEIENELESYGIPKEKIERFSAISYNPGCIGCSFSHICILKMALERGYRNVVILEDDFEFVTDRKTFYENLEKMFQEDTFYKPWDVILWNYNIYNPDNRVEAYGNSSTFGYVRYAQTTSAYIVNGHYIPKLLNNFLEGVNRLLDTRITWLYSIDVYWRELQKKDEWLYFKEKIGKQRASYTNTGYEDEIAKITNLSC